MATLKSFSMFMIVLSASAFTLTAQGQVVIDMPAPKRQASVTVVRIPDTAPPAVIVPSPSMAATPTAVVTPTALFTEGDLALSRYARARTLPRDTYYIADRFAGTRQYGYPLVWWGGFGFPHFHVHGNKFIGHLGRTHCHGK